MTVTDKAVEAAARAIYEQNPCGEQDFDADFRPTGTGYVIKFDALPEYDAGLYELSLNQARAALEAAAPHMLPAPEEVSEAEERAIALVDAARRFIAAEEEHARLSEVEAQMGLYPGALTSRDEVDLCHAVLVEFTVEDCDTARSLLTALSSERERAKGLEARALAAEDVLSHADIAVAASDDRADRAEFLLALALECARVAQPWKLFYGDGLTLGEVAERLGGSVYSYSPWLTAHVYDAETRAQSAEAKVKELEAPFDWTAEDLVDLMAEAIMDAIDIDTNATDYARAALIALNKEGLLRPNDYREPQQ